MEHEIYALFDFALNVRKNLTIDAFLTLPKVQKATILQYRDKRDNYAVKLQNILYIKERFEGKLIVNDDLALAQYADGLHVGQKDLLRYETSVEKSVLLLRRELGDKILGISTHNKDEIITANTLPLDYIGLGAYRNTSTKSVDQILGDKISTLASISKHDVAAIGGVRSTDIIPNVTYLVLGSDLYEN